MATGKTAASILSFSTLGIVPAKVFSGRKSSQNQMEIPQPPPLPKAPDPADAAASASEVIKKKRAASTQSIYTSPLGIGGEAQVARKTLLGQ